jgi:hypothetical protein
MNVCACCCCCCCCRARPCARSRERHARRAAVVGKAEDGRVRSGRVLPLCVGKRKGGNTRGQRTQKAQESKDTDWYSESCPPGLAVPPSPLFTLTPPLLSHFTPPTSHFTPPLLYHHHHQHGEGPRLLRDKLLSSLAGFPCPQRTSAAFGGWYPLLLARACPGRTRTSQPPRCTATLNGARMLIFLWLAWWGSHVSIGTGPVHRGLPPPCSSGSRNGTLLLLSVHTTVTGHLAPTGAAKSLLLLSVLSPTSSVNVVYNLQVEINVNCHLFTRVLSAN